jgi:CHAT domain-containing protein
LAEVVAALILTRDEARVIVLPAGAQALRDQIKRLLAGLQPRIGSFVDLSRASLDLGLARQLYEDLILPLAPVLADRTHLTIVPDAPLHLLPYDVLVHPGHEATEYLIDRYTVTTATSLGSVAAGDYRLPLGPVLAVAVQGPRELLSTEGEVESIERAFADREVVRLEQADASEESVREHAGTAAILHFATHASSNAADPDFAHLALEQAGYDDGLLHAYEIRQLRLPGSLVILSACESASGRLVQGEGPLSLSRSFLQAGAHDVVGTLWPVGATAGTLMQEFYRFLAEGSPPADALRAAKLHLRTTHPNPLYWGPYILVTRGS